MSTLLEAIAVRLHIYRTPLYGADYDALSEQDQGALRAEAQIAVNAILDAGYDILPKPKE